MPTATRRPSTVAIAPWPGTFSNPVAVKPVDPAVVGVRGRSPAASGCSDSRSTAAASASSSASSMPAATTSVTSGSPLVRVPVLSITTVSIRAEVSSAVAFLNSTPRRAPSPVPTMIAVGVARPSASGQVIDHDGDREQQRHRQRLGRRTAPTRRRSAAPPSRATNTSQNAARSASRCPGALEFCACCTSATICASALSAPTLVARTRSVPSALIGRADDLAARGLVHRQALPGDHRLVDLGLAVLDDPVDRDLRAGPDQQQVTGDDLGGGHLDLAAVAEHHRPGWGEVEQGADGVVGAAAGAHLEPVPEQHERGQHGGGLVEHLAAAGEGDHQRVAASRRRPRRRPAPSCPACGPAAPGRRRRRRSTPSRRSPAGCRISENTSSRSPNGAGTSNPSTSRPIGDHSSTGTDSTAATRNRLRMSATIAAIDIPPCPPWPIISCGDTSAAGS